MEIVCGLVFADVIFRRRDSKAGNTSVFAGYGHRSFIRNNTQTAVTNMTIKRMLENVFRHTSSEVTVKNRSNK